MAIVISNITNLVLFIFFCRMTLGKNNKNKFFLILVIFIQMLKIYVSQDFSPLVNLFLAMFLNLSVLFIFMGKLSKKLLLLFIYMCYSIIAEEMGLLVIENVFDRKVELNNVNFYFLNLISIIFLLMFIIVTIIILYSVKKESIKWGESLIIMTFPLAIIFFIIFSRYPLYIDDVNLGFLITVILFLIAITINCFELYKIQNNNQIHVEYELLKEKQKSDKEYFDLLLKKSEKERLILHDVNKHDQFLSLLLNENKVDEAIKYLNQNIHNRTQNHVILTKNKTLDLIIEMNRDKIVKNRISLDICEVTKVDLGEITEVDQCTIFANILENAIESCIKSSNKNISISLIKNINGKIIFKIVNSCDEVILNKDVFVSTKEEKGHGYGLKNVSDCLLKYNGILTTSYKDNLFTTIIVFQ